MTLHVRIYNDLRYKPDQRYGAINISKNDVNYFYSVQAVIISFYDTVFKRNNSMKILETCGSRKQF